jgi:sugar lactone lactonase YvrE
LPHLHRYLCIRPELQSTGNDKFNAADDARYEAEKERKLRMKNYSQFALKAILAAIVSCVAVSSELSAQTRLIPSAVTTVATVPAGLLSIATDKNGNVYFLDSCGIHELVAINGVVTPNSETLTLTSNGQGAGLGYVMQDGFSNQETAVAIAGYTPISLAVDGSGNIYYSASTSTYMYGHAGEIVELKRETVASTDANGVPLYNYYSSQITSAAGIPGGLSLNGAATIANFFDTSNPSAPVVYNEALTAGSPKLYTEAYSNAIKNPRGLAYSGFGEVVADGAYTSLLVPGQGPNYAFDSNWTIGGGLNNPAGIAADGQSDIYVADTGNYAVKEVPYGCAAASCTITLAGEQITGNPETSPFSQVVAVAVDQNGNVYAADQGKGTIVRISTHSFDFGGVSVCAAGQSGTCSQTMAVNFFYPNSSGDVLSSIQVLSEGSSSGDFVLADTTCPTGARASALADALCTVDVTFTPHAPGQRTGAIMIMDGGNNILATTYLKGTGTGAAAAFDYGTQLSMGSGYSEPSGLAQDANGNLWIADTYNHSLKEIPNGSSSAVIVSQGFGMPEGVAVDGAGNILVADWQNGTLSRLIPSLNEQFTVATGFNHPSGVAVDGDGNVYVADSSNNQIVKVTPAGVETKVITGLNYPFGVAIDGSGNLYVSNSNSAQVLKIAPNGTKTTIGTGWGWPGNLAVDAGGSVYVSDNGNGVVVRVAPDGTQSKLGTGFSGALGLALGSNGTVFVSDIYANTVTELPRAVSIGLVFNVANVGQSSAAKSVNIQNIGNEPLGAISIPNYAFHQAGGSGDLPNCGNGDMLASGEGCNLSMYFVPTTAGATSGAVQTSKPSTALTPSIPLLGITSAPVAIMHPLL